MLETLSTEINLLQIDTIKTITPPTNSKPTKILDITELDIKNQTRIELEQNEFDFFEDMEPIIEPNSKFLIDTKKDHGNNIVSSKLSVNIEDANEEGWGDDWE